MIDLRWFLRDIGFEDLAKILDSAKNPSTFTSSFVESIMENFWYTYKMRIFWR